jgi:flagellar capping protein FliD
VRLLDNEINLVFMTTMVLSPIQQDSDYLTRGEFRDHNQYMRNGFEKVFEQIDNVEIHLIDRLDKVDARIDSVDKRIDSLESNMNRRFSSIDRKIDNITNVLTKKS